MRLRIYKKTKCDFVKRVLEDNKSIKPVKTKLSFERWVFFFTEKGRWKNHKVK